MAASFAALLGPETSLCDQWAPGVVLAITLGANVRLSSVDFGEMWAVSGPL